MECCGQDSLKHSSAF